MNAIDSRIWELFSKDIAALKNEYDYVIFDCAPGISPVTDAAIRLADLVIVPTIPDYLSIYGLNAFHGSIWVSKSGGLRKPKSAPYILVSRVQNIRQHRMVVEYLILAAQKEGNYYKLLQAAIPQSAGLADALMNPEFLTYTRKYSGPFINQTLQPLVTEIKGLL